LEHLSEVDERLAPIAESLFELVSDANEILASVTATADSDDSDSVDLDELETRLNWLQDLSRKHRTDEDGLVERLSSLRQELESMGFEVEDLDALDERRQQLESEAVELALQIREVRIEAATRLESATASELRELGMPHAHLRFDDGIDGDGVTVNDLNASGAGRPRIVFQANPGAGWEDLSVAASGGELSRVLLSLHALFAELHAIPLVVFDEIEAGVGPRLGLTLGTRLASLSRSHQVLAITHLPQLASFADRHLKITKKVRGSSTSVQVNVIEGKARADELAEMLGGGDKGLARQQAASLLKEAESRADS
jgi:DNA repair protein RecN (Recombination protein N)